jgi:benzoyl-CoA reductase/2-hydroxyglutaryl-CoA dehydratase subunit BcrC/BadD/HgdB
VTVVDDLKVHYTDPYRTARSWRAMGEKVCGYLGSDTPIELIHAAGLLPVRVVGRPGGPTPLADRYGLTLDPVTRATFEALLDGSLNFLDFLVIDHAIEAHVGLFYTLREIQTVEPIAGLPDFHFLDIVHLPHLASAQFSLVQVQRLKAQLERWTGNTIADGAIASAIAQLNADRRALASLGELRVAELPRLSGAEALQLIGATMVTAPGGTGPAIDVALTELSARAGRAGRRVFVTGSAHEQSGVYEAIEATGATVVGEDHDWGDRFYQGQVDESAPWDLSLRDYYHFGPPASHRYYSAERTAYTAEQALRCKADVVLAYLRNRDDAPAWDIRDTREQLQAEGIPLVVLDRQPYKVDRAALTERFRELLAQEPARA